jgi:hypothetical protein
MLTAIGLSIPSSLYYITSCRFEKGRSPQAVLSGQSCFRMSKAGVKHLCSRDLLSSSCQNLQDFPVYRETWAEADEQQCSALAWMRSAIQSLLPATQGFHFVLISPRFDRASCSRFKSHWRWESASGPRTDCFSWPVRGGGTVNRSRRTILSTEHSWVREWRLAEKGWHGPGTGYSVGAGSRIRLCSRSDFNLFLKHKSKQPSSNKDIEDVCSSRSPELPAVSSICERTGTAAIFTHVLYFRVYLDFCQDRISLQQPNFQAKTDVRDFEQSRMTRDPHSM